MTIKRIGFACKLVQSDSKKGIVNVPECQVSTTTISWLNRQNKDTATKKLWELMIKNIKATQNLVSTVAKFEPELRMVRIGSDILPAYTHEKWKWFWKQKDIVDYCEKEFPIIGDIARSNNVRLSMHPGQFLVLSSENSDIVNRSIEEFEYHADMARWLSYGKTFQDFKINVHIAGRRGPAGIKAVLPRLSTEARNCITIENDEMSWGIDASLELCNDIALVLDIHHHWVATGEYIKPDDDRFKRIIDSWRGVRPVIHYSYSRDEHLPIGFDHSNMPALASLLESGHRKQKLRAHSDFYPNLVVNEWALSFLDKADIMCESKRKNLASFQLYEQAKELGIV